MDAGELQRLHDAVTRANEATTLEGIAKMLVDEGMAVLGVPIAGVWLVKGDRLDVVSFGGSPIGPWEAVAIDGDSPLATAVRTRAPVWLATPAEYAARFPASRDRMTQDVACVCLPLVVHDRAIGGAVFASMTTFDLSEAEKTKLMLIAGQCAHALDRLRLIEAERAAHRDVEDLARRMSGLQALAGRLAAARGLDDVARITTEDAVATLGASAASIWSLDGDAIALVSAQGIPPRVAAEIARLPMDDPGPLATSIRERKPIWLSSRAAATGDIRLVPSRWEGVNAGAALPLVAEGELVGGFVVVFAEARAFERSERETIETFAAHCALAIDRLRWIDRERAARRDAERLAERMQALQAAAIRLAAARGVTETARTICSGVRSAVGGTGVGLWLVEDDVAVLYAHEGWREELVTAGARIPLDDGRPIAATLRSREPMWIDRESAARDFAFSPERWKNIESGANVPLVVDDRLVGAFCITFGDSRPFTVAERELLEVYARHAAQALDRARLVEATTKLAGRMTALQATAARLAAARSFDDVAEIAVSDAVASVIGAKAAGLWRLEGRELVLVKQIGHPPDAAQRLRRVALDHDDLLPEAVRARKAQYVESRSIEREPSGEPRWAAVSAPLLAGERVLGVIGLGFDQPRSFDLGDREMIQLFADHVAQAIARERDHAAQRLLADASSSLAGSLDANAVLEQVGSLTVAAFADWCFVDLVRPDGTLERAVVAHADSADAELAESLRRVGAPMTNGVSTAIASKQPFVIGHISEADLSRTQRTDETGRLARAVGAQAVVCVPMVVGGRAIGAITWITRTRSVDDEDIAIATQIARAAAASLENARLYAAEAEAARRLRKLYELTIALTSARTPQEVASVATRLGSEASGADQGFLWMLGEGGVLRCIGAHGAPDWIEAWSLLPPRPELPAHRVLATGEAIWVETESDYEREAAEVAKAVRAAGRELRPFVALPLVIAGVRRGVLTFGYPTATTHRFEPNERTFFSAVARSCEQALERAELYATEANARAAAETASQTKDAFLAMLGHELRNPLSPIVTALELLRMRGSEEGARERAIIERQVSHLTRLVDDLLDISRITRGKIELRRAPEELLAAVEPAIEAVSPLLAKHKHTIRVDVAAKGLCVDGDRERLSQVVRNLVTNAAKYTPSGGHIDVSARVDGKDVELVVADNGRGIGPELLPRVFEPFVQAAQGADRAGGGLGLGLAIVKSVVELHGGSVAVASQEGSGTRVTVRLPHVLELRRTVIEGEAPPRSARGMRVLVVDDNRDAAVLLGDLLRALGHDPVIAHDGAGALEIASKDQPELAILDLGLPGMDGYELARALSNALVPKAIPVIALTGYGQASDRERSRAAGFVEHLVKPVGLQDLHAVVERFASS